MTINQSIAKLPRHLYRVVLADPPWNFSTWSELGMDRSAQQHYRCMTFGDILRINIRPVCDLDCWLFMWATGPLLPQALQTITAWGFEYSGVGFTWAKTTSTGEKWHVGLGHTTRHNAELCLLAKRGKPSRNSRGVRELIVAPVREHSRKPDEIYSRIEAFCDGPRLEMFGREKRRGWKVIGDQSDKF